MQCIRSMSHETGEDDSRTVVVKALRTSAKHHTRELQALFGGLLVCGGFGYLALTVGEGGMQLSPRTFSTLTGFFATLIATLIGVITAFRLDHRASTKRKRKRVLQHLQALQKEFTINKQIAYENTNIAETLSHGHNKDADHYIMDPFATDAWDAATNEQIIGEVSNDLYHDLQDLYASVKQTNEQIRRLRTEGLYTGVDENRLTGPFDKKDWTIIVGNWDEDNDKYDIWGLGILIRNRCNEISTTITSTQDALDSEMQALKDTGND